jgi:hypothetical protein
VTRARPRLLPSSSSSSSTESITIMNRLHSLLAAIGAAFVAAAAHAAPPANIANTTWMLRVDGGADEVLFIDTQNGPGAPGNSVCRGIRGNFVSGNVPVRGWYCPDRGRIHLLHENKGSRLVMRAFIGNVSDAVDGQPLRMEGAVAIDNANFGDLGEASFEALQQP